MQMVPEMCEDESILVIETPKKFDAIMVKFSAPENINSMVVLLSSMFVTEKDSLDTASAVCTSAVHTGAV